MPKDAKGIEYEYSKLIKEMEQSLSGKSTLELDYEKPLSHITNSALWKGLSDEERQVKVEEMKIKKAEMISQAIENNKYHVVEEKKEVEAKTEPENEPAIFNANEIYKAAEKNEPTAETPLENTEAYYNTFNNPYAYKNKAFTQVTGKETESKQKTSTHNVNQEFFISEVPSFIPAQFVKPLEPIKRKIIDEVPKIEHKQVTPIQPKTNAPLPKQPATKAPIPK